MRYFLTIVGLLLVVGTIALIKASQISALMGFGDAMASAGPPATAVSTTPAAVQTWDTTLQTVGTVESVKGVQISGEVPGVIDRIRFESGDFVEQRDILVELDRRVEQAQLAAARVRRKLALTTVKRTRALGAMGADSQANLDADESALDQSEVEIKVLQAQIARKVIRAPFSGRLGIRAVNPGQYLGPGTPITTIESVNGTFVDFELPQQRRADLSPGLAVRLSMEGSPGLRAKGTIVAIDPSVDPSTRMIKARAAVAEQHEELEPGMFVQVEVVLPDQQTVVAVPLTAIVYASFGNSVFVVEPAPDAEPHAPANEGPPALIARQQFVQLAQRRGDFVAVVDGVSEGDVLVSAGAFKLRNNAPITVNNDAQLTPQLHPDPTNR